MRNPRAIAMLILSVVIGLGEQDAYARKEELLAFMAESPVQASLATA